MINQKLTDRPEKVDFTESALIHIAEPLDLSQGPDGSSYKYKLSRLLASLSPDRLDYGKIVKVGKGFTISGDGIYTPNTGPMSLAEKGDIYRGVTAEGLYLPYMRYYGGSLEDFNSFRWDAALSAWLPGEPGYVEPEVIE